MDIDAIRERIPATRTMTYMNTGWAGPTPQLVTDAIGDRLQYEAEAGPTAPEVYESGKQVAAQAKEAVAGLLNASPHEVLLTQNTTEGLGIVTGGLSWSPGDEVITFGVEHASPLLAAYRLRDRWGVQVKRLPVDTDATHETVLSAVEGVLTDRTRAVIMSHIEYSCGLRMPVKEIAALLRPNGALLIVDGAQTAGHIPIDVRALDCDAYSIPGQKWLMGPDGTGALYVRRSLIPQIEPKKLAFDGIEQIAMGYVSLEADDIDLLMGSTSSTPLRVGFLEAVRSIQRTGVEGIEARNLSLAASLKRRLAEIAGVTVTSPMEGPECSGLVTFTIDGADLKGVVSAMWKRDRVLVRAVPYPPAIRASLHYFNTEDEVDRLADAVRGAAEGAAGA